MTNVCAFPVVHCVEGTFDAASRGTPKSKHGATRWAQEVVVVVFGPFLFQSGARLRRHATTHTSKKSSQKVLKKIRAKHLEMGGVPEGG